MYTKYLCLKARRVSLSSIHFSFVICSLMQMNWPQANRFITWQHIHKASSIQRKESWTTVIEDTKKCTDPKLMSLAMNRLNLYPDSCEWHNEPQETRSLVSWTFFNSPITKGILFITHRLLKVLNKIPQGPQKGDFLISEDVKLPFPCSSNPRGMKIGGNCHPYSAVQW